MPTKLRRPKPSTTPRLRSVAGVKSLFAKALMKSSAKLSNTSDKYLILRRVCLAVGSNTPNFRIIITVALLLSVAAVMPMLAQFSVETSPADSALMPHFLRIGTEKVANTFIFTGSADALIALPIGMFAVKQQYRGTAIRSGNAAFRDDEQLTAEFTLPLDTAFSLAARGFWLLSKDSRDIGLSSLSQAGGSAGLRWRPSAFAEAAIMVGGEQTAQLGRQSPGSILGLNAKVQRIDLEEFTGDFALHAEYSRLDAGRVNSDVDIAAVAERSSGSGIARFAARQRWLNRDYFLPVAANGMLGVESRLERRSEISADIIQPLTENILQFEARLQLDNVGVERSFFAAAAGTPLTAVERGLSEFSLNVTGAFRLMLPVLQLYGGATFALRDEANAIRPVFEILPADESQLKQSEFQRDNSSTRTRLFGQALWNISHRDTLKLSVASSILRYDTPSDLNYDDRDELLLNGITEFSRRFTGELSAGAGFSLQMQHTVFLKSQRSSLNNWNRILKFFTRAEILTRVTEFRPQFEVLANYTVYDFEHVGGTSSFSFRQMSVRDSIIIWLGHEMHAEGRLFARYFITGQLNWENFSETPLNTNYEQFVKILIFTRPAPNISLGIGGRYYALSQQAAGASVLPGGIGSSLQQFYGPEAVVAAQFDAGTRLALNGWYERQFVNKALLRNSANLFLTVTTPL